jgi:hypothetical protein
VKTYRAGGETRRSLARSRRVAGLDRSALMVLGERHGRLIRALPRDTV